MKEAIEALFTQNGVATPAHVEALKGIRSLADVTAKGIDEDAMDCLGFFLDDPEAVAQGEQDENRRTFLQALAVHLVPPAKVVKPVLDTQIVRPVVPPTQHEDQGEDNEPGLQDPRKALLAAFGDVDIPEEKNGEETKEIEADNQQPPQENRRGQHRNDKLVRLQGRREESTFVIPNDIDILDDEEHLDDNDNSLRDIRRQLDSLKEKNRRLVEKIRETRQHSRGGKNYDQQDDEEHLDDNDDKQGKGKGKGKGKKKPPTPQPPKPGIVLAKVDHLLARVHVDPFWIQVRDYIFGQIQIVRKDSSQASETAQWQLSQLAIALEHGQILAERYPYNVRVLAAEMITSLFQNKDKEVIPKDKDQNWFQTRYGTLPPSPSP